MLDKQEYPSTIHYSKILKFLDGIDDVGGGISEYFSGKIRNGLFDKEMYAPTKVVPKDIFFVKLSHYMERFLANTYRSHYYSDRVFKSKTDELRFHLARSLYTHLSDFDKIQLGYYRMSVISSENLEIASVNNMDLSFLMNKIYNGIKYIDVLSFVGELRKYIYSDEYLKDYAGGILTIMNWLSSVSAKIDIDDIYSATITIGLQDSNNNSVI